MKDLKPIPVFPRVEVQINSDHTFFSLRTIVRVKNSDGKYTEMLIMDNVFDVNPEKLHISISDTLSRFLMQIYYRILFGTKDIDNVVISSAAEDQTSEEERIKSIIPRFQ